MLSSELARQKADNRQCILKILSNFRFLARQGLAIRGSGDDKDSNFTQLLKLRSEDDGRIVDWLSKKTDKYASHDMQNENESYPGNGKYPGGMKLATLLLSFQMTARQCIASGILKH